MQARGSAAWRGFRGPESRDRLEQTLAVPQWHADLFEVGFDQVAQDARVDLMRNTASYCPRSIAFATGRRSSSFPHTVRL